MGIKGIAYVHLLVEHWTMALEFYRDIVGLEVEQLFEVEEWVSFNLSGAKLVIYGGGVGSLQPKGADKNAFIPNVECDDLEATVAELEERGVPFIATPAESPEGYRLATFVDPEGNRIQLFEWAREGEPA
jgi:predicted enzyme related to lactoylglutathione lyase